MTTSDIIQSTDPQALLVALERCQAMREAATCPARREARENKEEVIHYHLAHFHALGMWAPIEQIRSAIRER